MCTAAQFVCLFTNPFTPPFAARVWDAYFFEGAKVLFRTALALLRSVKRSVLSSRHFSDVMTLLDGVGSRIHSRSDILLFFGAGGHVPLLHDPSAGMCVVVWD